MVDLVEFDAGDIANTSNVANILLAFDMPSYMHPPLMLEFVLAMPTFKTSVFIPQIGELFGYVFPTGIIELVASFLHCLGFEQKVVSDASLSGDCRQNKPYDQCVVYSPTKLGDYKGKCC